MLKLCINIWPCVTMKISPETQQIFKSRFNILPNKKKPSKFCLTLSKFCQSGEISPNMVTLKARSVPLYIFSTLDNVIKIKLSVDCNAPDHRGSWPEALFRAWAWPVTPLPASFWRHHRRRKRLCTGQSALPFPGNRFESRTIFFSRQNFWAFFQSFGET